MEKLLNVAGKLVLIALIIKLAAGLIGAILIFILALFG